MAELSASVKLRGGSDLDAALRALPEEVSGPIMEAALRAGGLVVLRAARANIHSRTGKTAADVRMEVQVEPNEYRAVAAIGGTHAGRTGRAQVLRWLEFGTRSSKKLIIAGARARRVLKTKIRREIRNRNVQGAVEYAKAANIKRALKLPWGLRGSAKHRGIAGQSPLTRALAEHGDQAIAAFVRELWRGIAATAARLARAA